MTDTTKDNTVSTVSMDQPKEEKGYVEMAKEYIAEKIEDVKDVLGLKETDTTQDTTKSDMRPPAEDMKPEDKTLTEKAGEAWEGVKDTAQEKWNEAKLGFENVKEKTGDETQKLKDTTEQKWNETKQGFENVKEKAGDQTQKLKDTTQQKWNEAKQGMQQQGEQAKQSFDNQKESKKEGKKGKRGRKGKRDKGKQQKDKQGIEENKDLVIAPVFGFLPVTQDNKKPEGTNFQRDMKTEFPSQNQTPPSQISELPEEKIVISGFGSDNLSNLSDQNSSQGT